MKTYKIKTEDAFLEVFIGNEKAQETIVLLNGGPGILYYLYDVSDFLMNKMRVISYNQRGVGESKALNKSYKVDDHLKDLKTIVTEFNLDKFHLFGHAWGGLLGQLYANKYPEQIKSLFLCNSFIGTGRLWEDMESDILDYCSEILKDTSWIYFLITQALLGLRGFSGIALKYIITIMQYSYFKNSELNRNGNQTTHLKVISGLLLRTRHDIVNMPDILHASTPNIPVLILSGSKDIISENNWRIEERWPYAQKIDLTNSGHFPWVESPKQFFNILDQYYDVNREDQDQVARR